MQTPEAYIASVRDLSDKELIRERAKLLSDIKKFEKDDLPSDAWLSDPSPAVVYARDLRALARLCDLLAERAEAN